MLATVMARVLRHGIHKIRQLMRRRGLARAGGTVSELLFGRVGSSHASLAASKQPAAFASNLDFWCVSPDAHWATGYVAEGVAAGVAGDAARLAQEAGVDRSKALAVRL